MELMLIPQLQPHQCVNWNNFWNKFPYLPSTSALDLRFSRHWIPWYPEYTQFCFKHPLSCFPPFLFLQGRPSMDLSFSPRQWGSELAGKTQDPSNSMLRLSFGSAMLPRSHRHSAILWCVSIKGLVALFSSFPSFLIVYIRIQFL